MIRKTILAATVALGFAALSSSSASAGGVGVGVGIGVGGGGAVGVGVGIGIGGGGGYGGGYYGGGYTVYEEPMTCWLKKKKYFVSGLGWVFKKVKVCG